MMFVHEAAGDHLVAFGRASSARASSISFWPMLVGVHVGLVRQVHQVVDHQPVVALRRGTGRRRRPTRGSSAHGRWWSLRRIGLRRVARPDPDEAVALDHRVGADRRKAAHALAGHRDASCRRSPSPGRGSRRRACLSTHAAERQRRAAVRAEVLERRDRAASGRGRSTIGSPQIVRPSGFAGRSRRACRRRTRRCERTCDLRRPRSSRPYAAYTAGVGAAPPPRSAAVAAIAAGDGGALGGERVSGTSRPRTGARGRSARR